MNLRAMVLVLLGCLVGSNGLAQEAPPAWRLIVNPKNPMVAIDRSLATEAFLKKTTFWRNGTAIRPADLDASSPVRRKFTEQMLGRSLTAVKSYWQQMIFAGRGVPPPELDSDEQVLQYVRQHPGGIGYVSGAADVRTVKVLMVK